MKRTSILAPALTAALLAIPALGVAQQSPAGGQQQPAPQADQQRPQDERDQRRQGRAGAADQHMGQQEVLRADRLTGQVIRDHQGERLGRINDLAVDVQENRVTHAVVNRGGMWGIGGDEVIVSWDQIRPDAQQRVVRMDRQQLEQAREVDRGQWSEAFGDDAAVDEGPARAYRVRSISNILGMEVTDRQGERLGTIDEIVIARDGAVSYAVISYGGFLGVGDNHIAVPWDRMEFDDQRESLTLDVTEQQFEQAREQQRFRERRGDAWPARVDWPFGAGR